VTFPVLRLLEFFEAFAAVVGYVSGDFVILQLALENFLVD
jgi:hypothetical protein